MLGVVLVEVDSRVDLGGTTYVFQGDGPAARTVLSVIAGSLITVAGLTFSITMVVLQLASSQFSPRILRTFFGDRITQITIGTYVGIFVYSILVLRAVGSFDQSSFVPRLSVTVASLLGIAAVILLIAFLHHVSQMVQVSQVTAKLTRATLAKIDEIYPESMGEGDAGSPAAYEHLGGQWAQRPFGPVRALRPGYVQRVSVEDLLAGLGKTAERAQIMVCPGDFVSIETPIVRIWPATSADECRGDVLAAFTVSSERDLDQDVDFGVRQLTDITLKALSPGINDPMTAVTCISYLRSILVRLTERADLAVLLDGAHGLTLLARRRSYAEHFQSSYLQINRYVAGDAWVAGEMIKGLSACAEIARSTGSIQRLSVLSACAVTIVERTLSEVGSAADRQRIQELDAEFRRQAVMPDQPHHGQENL